MVIIDKQTVTILTIMKKLPDPPNPNTHVDIQLQARGDVCRGGEGSAAAAPRFNKLDCYGGTEDLGFRVYVVQGLGATIILVCIYIYIFDDRAFLL